MNRRAFTLAEVLVAIAIASLAILGAWQVYGIGMKQYRQRQLEEVRVLDLLLEEARLRKMAKNGAINCAFWDNLVDAVRGTKSNLYVGIPIWNLPTGSVCHVLRGPLPERQAVVSWGTDGMLDAVGVWWEK